MRNMLRTQSKSKLQTFFNHYLPILVFNVFLHNNLLLHQSKKKDMPKAAHFKLAIFSFLQWCFLGNCVGNSTASTVTGNVDFFIPIHLLTIDFEKIHYCGCTLQQIIIFWFMKINFNSILYIIFQMTVLIPISQNQSTAARLHHLSAKTKTSTNAAVLPVIKVSIEK